jgi:sugar phosphate isomerase/epimerase
VNRRVTFCSNILPGSDFESHLNQLKDALPLIRKACPWLKHLGLRMSEAVARRLNEDAEACTLLNRVLTQNEMTVSTLNIFPQGEFHSAGVKESVYLPDWSTRERLEYTKLAANALLKLKTPKVVSMSTVPVGYKAHHKEGFSDSAIFNILEAAEYLANLQDQTGQTIRLALEPEPDCLLETSDETIEFFSQLRSVASPLHAAAIEKHLGVCFDTCHFAVNFESPKLAIQKLAENKIEIFKFQLTSALAWKQPLEEDDFLVLDDRVYLHQTRSAVLAPRKIEGSQTQSDKQSAAEASHGIFKIVNAWPDTPASCKDLNSEQRADEWRCHFHTPLFVESYGKFVGTQPETLAALKAAFSLGLDADVDLEIETYTWGVLPKQLKTTSIHDCIISELKWADAKVKSCLEPKHC